MLTLVGSVRNLFSSLRREPGPFIYAALGDSTVEGTGASHHSRSYAHLVYVDLARRYENASYYNFGRYGAKVHDVLADQLAQAASVQPNLITISAGANDVLQDTDLNAFREDINRLLKTLGEQTDALLVVTTIPDFSLTRHVPRTAKQAVRLRIRQYNHHIREAAAAAGAIEVDTFKKSAQIIRRFPRSVSTDRFHPSDVGYKLWARFILTAIHAQPPFQERRWTFG